MNHKLLRITTVSHSIDLLLKGQLEYLGKKGFDISIACSKDDEINTIARRENVEYYELALTRTINPIKDLISLLATIRLIKKLNPKIVHTHSPKAGVVGMLAARICRTPLKIHTVAGLPLIEAKGFKRKLLIQVEKLTYWCADFVLPNSIRQKEFIEQEIYKGDKLHVIGKGSSNGIDLDYFNPDILSGKELLLFKNNLKIPQDNKVLCFVGRLTNYKGVNELVEAFLMLNKVHSNLTLLLVGPFEDLNPLDQNNLEEIRNNKNIISVGHQLDIRPFLLISDIFVFPSYREGFPQSLMQAAAMNLACVATDINGCNEIIENEVTGLLIEPKNRTAIFDGVNRLIEDNSLRKNLAMNARELMENSFEQKKFWDEVINFYRRNLNK